MKIKQKIVANLAILFILTTALSLFAPAPSAFGADPESSGEKCETAILPDSLCNSGDSVESNGTWGLLLIVINVLTAGVVIVAIGGFVYGAILYTTAEANAGQVTKAKETIFNVILGLVAFAAMWAFLQFLIPGGIFS